MEHLKPTVENMPKNLPKGHIMMNNDRTGGMPDLVKLTGNIIEFIEYIETPSVKEMAKENKMTYKLHLENKFEEFTLDFYSIYKMLVDDETNRNRNLEKLFNMIDKLKDVEAGKTNVEREFFKVREELAQEFLYPQFGGKEKFQKALEKDAKNKK
jgi:hypothetical protein